MFKHVDLLIQHRHHLWHQLTASDAAELFLGHQQPGRSPPQSHVATAPALDHRPLNEAVVRRTPAHRWGTPDDLSGIAVYLASDASRFHTGDSIRIDGGYSVF